MTPSLTDRLVAALKYDHENLFLWFIPFDCPDCGPVFEVTLGPEGMAGSGRFLIGCYKCGEEHNVYATARNLRMWDEERDAQIAKPNPLIYLAGPITHYLETHAKPNWRGRAEAFALEWGVSVFNPLAAFKVHLSHIRDPAHIDPIQAVCDEALRRSGAVVVAAQEIPSKGTAHEMELCARLRKPVVVWRKRIKENNVSYLEHIRNKTVGSFSMLDEAIAVAAFFTRGKISDDCS